jgi:hypothetical protein
MDDASLGSAKGTRDDMNESLSRRDFIKLGGFGLSSLAFSQYFPFRGDQSYPEHILRVTYPAASVYREPKMDATYVRDHYRDELITAYYDLIPPEGPAYNPLWYRVWGGYMHSAYLQPVEIRFNNPIYYVREGGQLAEVTVPFTQAYGYSRTNGWQRVNRLYYSTTHWITGIDEGPDGKPWYRMTDELQPVDYFAPAIHLRPIPDEEFSPISPDVPFEGKHIEISLIQQKLKAYEQGRIVMDTKVSTGIPNTRPTLNGIPTTTPSGRFNIYSKMPSKHMGNARLTDNLDDYVLLGVPWTSFFVDTGVALHGTYWHHNFGWPMSRGCVNLRNEDAKWLFRWIVPVSKPTDWEKTGYGTQVIVHD